jgi:hypothetical protein
MRDWSHVDTDRCDGSVLPPHPSTSAPPTRAGGVRALVRVKRIEPEP